MAYSTLDDLTAIDALQTLQQLTDDENAGDLNTAVVDSAIVAADAEIDLYLRARFSASALPLSPVPEIIRVISSRMALGELYSRRRQELPQSLADQIKSSRDMLGKISRGELSLGSDESNSAGFYRTNKTASDRVYTPENLPGALP